MSIVPPPNRPQEFTLGLRYTKEEGLIYLNGIHALARLFLDQNRADKRRGLKTAIFVSGYPGSPLGGIDLELTRLQKLLKSNEVYFTPGVNEDLAATAMLGSQMLHRYRGPKYDGVMGVWFGKGPGIDRTGDAFRHGNLMGVGENGGVLCLAGDDPTCKSSTIPSDSTVPLTGVGMPILFPGNVQDILDMGLHGFMLSRTSGLWVAMRIVTNVADGAGTAEVSPDRVKPKIPTMEIGGKPYIPKINLDAIATPLIVEAERMLYEGRLEMARRYAYENGLNRIVVPTKDAWLGIVAAGKTYYDTQQALSELGLSESALECYGIRFLKMGMTYPVEPRIIREFAAGLQEILVVEEKRSHLEAAIKDILYDLSERPMVVGKLDEGGQPLFPLHGELESDTIARGIAGRLARKTTIPSAQARIELLDRIKGGTPGPRMGRIPYFCSGCPHNRSLHVPEGSIVGAGIGCHSLLVFADPRIVGEHVGLTHMGGEGAQWVGLAPFTETPHMFQNLGDGTLFHSGSMAIRYAVSSKVNITYKILYNHAVAMTGGQDPTGAMSIPNLTRLLEAEGVKKIIITTDNPSAYKGIPLAKIATVWHRDRLVEAQSTLAATPGVTAMIHDQWCAIEKRRRRRRGELYDPPSRVLVNERVCEGCGDCGKKSNCLSVQPAETEFGQKVGIHQSSCSKDYSCVLGDCPSFLTIEPDAEHRKKERPLPALKFDFPEPELKVPADGYKMYMMGIGGTGVVTLNQILGTAAMLDGRHVRALDQTGLAQKGGPVVSHLKLSSAEADISNNVATGLADLYLAFDLLVATQPNNLAKAESGRSIAVVSTTKVPTGQMVADNTVRFPDVGSRLEDIRSVARDSSAFTMDAQLVAEALFGDHLAANNILLGAAYQLGAIPISLDSLEKAIRLNGVAVEMNLVAFQVGRLAVVDPKQVEEAVKKATEKPVPPRPPSADTHQLIDSVGATGEVRRLVEIRVPELIDYQDVSYARKYAEFVQKVRRIEEEKCPGQTKITEAVARYLYKLMAYKDEYEVARLHLDPGFQAEVKEKFGAKAKVYWHLEPPMLRYKGLRGKIKLGTWFTPGFKALRSIRHLRGTALDVFGKAEVRRVERALIDEYRQMVETALAKLTWQNHGAVTAIAALPDEIRGYEQIKLANVEKFRQKARDLLEQIDR